MLLLSVNNSIILVLGKTVRIGPASRDGVRQLQVAPRCGLPGDAPLWHSSDSLWAPSSFYHSDNNHLAECPSLLQSVSPAAAARVNKTNTPSSQNWSCHTTVNPSVVQLRSITINTGVLKSTSDQRYKSNALLLLPLPLLTKVVPVSLRLLHCEASTLNKALCYWTGFINQAQSPSRDWSSLDGIRGKKSRSHGTQEACRVRMCHSARLHSNCHQWQQLDRFWIPGGYHGLACINEFIMKTMMT